MGEGPKALHNMLNNLGSALLRITTGNKLLHAFGIVIMYRMNTSTIYKHKHNIVLDFIYFMVNFMLLIFKPNLYFEISILIICILEFTSIY